MNIDRVCGMVLYEKEAPVSYLYRERAYFFCSEACMVNFSADPERYVSGAEVKAGESGEKGGFFSRWIKKLGESAEKSPPPGADIRRSRNAAVCRIACASSSEGSRSCESARVARS